MSVIIRLQNLPLSAISIDIRNFFHGLSIPDGGVHICGGAEGDAFIAFSTDEDARQAMQLSGEKLKDSTVRLSLSSKHEMFKIIEQARVAANPEQAQPMDTPFANRSGITLPSPRPSSPPARSAAVSQQNVVNPSNMPNFGTLAGMGMLSGGIGMTGANFIGQNPTGMVPPSSMTTGSGMNNNVQQQQQQHPFSMGIGSNTLHHSHMSSSMGSSEHHSQQVGGSMSMIPATNNPNPFGVPPPPLAAGLGMTFPHHLMQTAVSSSQGMSTMNQNQAVAAMMGMGVPPPNMINVTSTLQGSNAFSSPRTMNQMNHHPGLSNQQMGLLDNNNQINLTGTNLTNLPGSNNQMNLPTNNNQMHLQTNNQMHLQTNNQMNHLVAQNPNQISGNNNQLNHLVAHNPNQLSGANNQMNHLVAHNPNQLSGNNNQMHPNLLHQNIMRPNSFPGMNPAFMVGGNAGNGGVVGNIMPPRQNGSLIQSVPPMRGRNPNSAVGQRPVASVRPDFNRDMSARSRSPSERRDRDRDGFRKDPDRRRRSRSRDRDRNNDRRRRSRSRSQSPKGRFSSNRRDSREKDSDKIRVSGRRDSRDAPDPPATPYNTTDEHHAAVKLTGVPSDASFREIKDFLRVDIMGGGDGAVRLYEECISYIKLERPSDFPKAFRSNGRRIRSSVISMEPISIERWVDEYKLNKSRMDRDVDVSKRERERGRDRQHHKDRDDRSSTERPERQSRPSRFNNAPQSSCIVIRNLPPTVTRSDVASRLLIGVVLVDVNVSAGPTANGRHTAIAHIKLESPLAAQQAIDQIVRSQDGSHLVVEISTNEEFNMAKMRTGAGPGRTNESDNAFKFANNLQQDTKTSIFDLESGLDDESCSVMLKGAPSNVSERDVFDFFSDIGLMPMNVKIMYDTDGSCNGQVVCEFPDPHKARRATTKDGMMFGRGLMQVELLPSGRKRMPDLMHHHIQGKTPFRPSLLGPRPGGGDGPSPAGGRYGGGGPAGPNPFVQALQGGPRGRGGGRGFNTRFGGPPRHHGLGEPNNGAVDRDDRLGGSGRGRAKGGGGRPLSNVDQESSDDTTVPATGFGKQGCVLSLENVPYAASMDDILHHLELSPTYYRDKIIRRFDESDYPTGDARVAFDTPAEAKLAHDRLVGTKMWNRLISYTIV